MGRTATPHPAIVCALHPRAGRRWKRLTIPGQPYRVSVCVACCPPARRSRCVNGHVHRVRRADGKLICRSCARVSSRRWHARKVALLRDDPMARNVAAMEASR